MQTPSTWTQRAGGLIAIPGLLRELGVSSAGILEAVGLAADALDHADSRLPYAGAVALLNHCAKVTARPDFGLLVGERWDLDAMGLPGRLVRHCDTLATAIETLTVYMRLNNQVAAAYFRESDTRPEFGYAVFQPQVTELAVAYDVATAAGVVQVREMLGNPRWRPAEVLLPRSVPSDAAPYKRHFGCPIRFDSDRAALVIPPGDVDQPLPQADAKQRERLLNEAQSLLGSQFLVRVHESLRLLLLQGSADSALVAAQLAIHRRTLIRRLAREGTSFQQILDQVRYDVARQLLRETQRSVTEIGAALGYSESSAFNHAFRRWSGCAPREWRKGVVS